MESRNRSLWIARAWAVSTIVVLGVVPLALDRDSFPISTYPMFSTRRSTREPVDTALFIDSSGHEVILDPPTIAGTDEPIIATVMITNALNDGTADHFCLDIAGRLGPDRVGRVEIVTVVYDALGWFEGDHQPISRVVHTSCDVGGP